MPVLCWESSPRFAAPQSRCSALSDSAGTNFQLCLAYILQKIRIPGISWNPYFFGGLPLWIFQFLTARESHAGQFRHPIGSRCAEKRRSPLPCTPHGMSRTVSGNQSPLREPFRTFSFCRGGRASRTVTERVLPISCRQARRF